MNRHIFLFVRWSMEEKTMSKLFISGGTVIDPEKPDYKTGDEFSPVWYVLAPGAAALIVIITGINTKRRHKRG